MKPARMSDQEREDAGFRWVRPRVGNVRKQSRNIVPATGKVTEMKKSVEGGCQSVVHLDRATA